jgi:hypothetical protein
MRTTIDISDALLRDLRAVAEARKTPLRKVVEDLLQRGLSAEPATGNVTIETHPVGVKAAYHGMSMNQLYDQLETDSFQKVAEQ